MFRLPVLFIIVLFAGLSPALAEVRVPDQVTTVGTPVMLSARTGGRFFPKGGELVEFHVEGHTLGKRLSGGDGYAFFEYRPKKRGLFTITARTGRESGKGLLLVTGRREQAVLVQIESGVMESTFPQRIREGTARALGIIHKKYPLIYITTLPAEIMTERILEKAGLPVSVILAWDTDLPDRLKESGISVKAAITSVQLLQEMGEYGWKVFTFEESEDDAQVNDWNEILKGLGIKTGEGSSQRKKPSP